MKQLFLLSLMVLVSVSSHAIVIEQTPADRGDGFYSGISGAGFNAEDFFVSSDMNLSSISWWGSYNSTPGLPRSDSFSVQIFSDIISDSADILSYSGTAHSEATSLFDIAGEAVYKYSIDVSIDYLSAGSSYYLSIVNDDTSSTFSEWFWLESNTGDEITWFKVPDWQEDSASLNLSYRLAGETIRSVPEPGTLILMLLPALWIARRFLTKKS